MLSSRSRHLFVAASSISPFPFSCQLFWHSSGWGRSQLLSPGEHFHFAVAAGRMKEKTTNENELFDPPPDRFGADRAHF